jgi:hypothetical protein
MKKLTNKLFAMQVILLIEAKINALQQRKEYLLKTYVEGGKMEILEIRDELYETLREYCDKENIRFNDFIQDSLENAMRENKIKPLADALKWYANTDHYWGRPIPLEINLDKRTQQIMNQSHCAMAVYKDNGSRARKALELTK